MILRDVEDVAIVDRCREPHIRVVMGEAFRLPAARGNPPHVHLRRVLNAARKVNPSTIGRPCLMMVVSSRNRIDKNLSGADTGAIRDEHRVARGVGVIHHPRAIGGPCHFNRAIDQERRRRSAHHRHDAHAADRRAAEPDFRSVAGETDISHRSQSRDVALPCEVHEAARTHLCQPRIERAITIGKKCGELAVRRERRLGLIAFKIRQPGERRIGQRVVGSLIEAPHTPPRQGRREREKNDRGRLTPQRTRGANGRASPPPSPALRRPPARRRAQRAHRRYPEGAASGLSPGCAAEGAPPSAAWPREAPPSPARAAGSPRWCPTPSRLETPHGRPAVRHNGQPDAQMSVRLSTACPRACSGLM